MTQASNTGTKVLTLIAVMAVALGPIAAAQLIPGGGGVPAAPTIHELTGECLPPSQSPISLKDVKGVTSPGQVTPRDLDRDGHNNEEELIELSDPTDGKSTPNDHDGDGSPFLVDPCDFDPSVPKAVTIEFVGEIQEEAERLDQIPITVEVTRSATTTAMISKVELLVTMSGGNAKEAIEMQPTATPGHYSTLLTIGIKDFANPDDPWVLDARATLDNGVSETVSTGNVVEGEELPQIAVSPTTFDVTVTLLNSDGIEANRFFLGQTIKVKAVPDYTRFGLAGPTENQRRIAVLTWDYEVRFMDGMVNQSAPGEILGVEMTEEEDGLGRPYWEAVVDPEEAFTPRVLNLILDNFGAGFASTAFHFTVAVEDDAIDANTGSESPAPAQIDFSNEFTLAVSDPPASVTKRLETLTFDVDYLVRGVPKAGPLTGKATIYTVEDGADANKVAEVTLNPVVGDVGAYHGEYTIGIGDPILAASITQPANTWFVKFDIGAASVRNVPFLVGPREVPGTITTPASDGADYTADENTIPFIPIEITYRIDPGSQFHNTPAAAAPGVAEYEIRNGQGALVASGPLDWTAGLEFDATAQVPAAAAILTPGEWTIRVSYEDDASVPNVFTAVRKIDVGADAGLAAVTSPPTVDITQVYGWNTDDPSSGLTSQALDPMMGADDETTRRFIVVRGTSTDGAVTISVNGEPMGTQPTQVTDVFVRFHDALFPTSPAPVPYYAAAGVEEDGSWEIVFDTLGYGWPDAGFGFLLSSLEANTDDVKIEAFAYGEPRPAGTGALAGSSLVSGLDPEIQSLVPQPADMTGLYSPPDSYEFDFDYRGPNEWKPTTVRMPKDGGGTQDREGGGVILITDDPTFVLEYENAEGSYPVDVDFFLGRMTYDNCDGENGDEWCLTDNSADGDTAFDTYDANGRQATPAWVDMTPSSGSFSTSTEWTVQLKDLRQGGSDRYWGLVQHTNIDGYKTRSNSYPGQNGDMQEFDSDQDAQIAPAEGSSTAVGTFPGFTFTQYTFVYPTINIEQVSQLSGFRPADGKAAGPDITWDDGEAELIGNWIGFIEGDQIDSKLSVDVKDPLGAATTIDEASVQFKIQKWTGASSDDPIDGTDRVVSGEPTSPLVPEQETAIFDGLNIPTDHFAEEVGCDQISTAEVLEYCTANYVRLTVSYKTSYGLSASDSVRMRVDRDASPGTGLVSLVVNDHQGGTVTLLPGSDLLVKGTGTFKLDVVDLDNALADDPRRLDNVEISFEKLSPPIQRFVGGANDDTAGVGTSPTVLAFPAGIATPEVCDDFLTGDCFGPYTGAEFYFPIRVGFDPLFLRIDDPDNPASWAPDPDDRVFGLDVADPEQGYGRLFGPEGTIGLQTGVWHTINYHAIEMNLDQNQGSNTPATIPLSPYIGLTTNGGNNGAATYLAIAVDRKFSEDPSAGWGYEGPGGPAATNPQAWDTVACTVANAMAANAAPNCPRFQEYQWVGIINGMTPFTLYAPAASTGVDVSGGCSGTAAASGSIRPGGAGAPDDSPSRCDTYDTRQDFLGPSQDGKFHIPRGFDWIDITNGRIGTTDEYEYSLVTLVPFGQLSLAEGNTPGKDMLLPDGDYFLSSRGIDGIDIRNEVLGGANDNGPINDVPFEIRNDADGDLYSSQLETKIRNQIRDGTHRNFPYSGIASLPNNMLPLADGTLDVIVPTPDGGKTATILAKDSTPCDWDGDGIPNDLECKNIIDLEALFNMHPFKPDNATDDPDGDGIPNFLDPNQRHRIDCEDGDGDGFCDSEEDTNGNGVYDTGDVSDLDNSRSTPNNPTGSLIPATHRSIINGILAPHTECTVEDLEFGNTECFGIDDIAGLLHETFCPSMPATTDLVACISNFVTEETGPVGEAAEPVIEILTGVSEDLAERVCELDDQGGANTQECIENIAESGGQGILEDAMREACDVVGQEPGSSDPTSLVICIQAGTVPIIVGAVCGTQTPSNPQDPTAAVTCATTTVVALAAALVGTAGQIVCGVTGNQPGGLGPVDCILAEVGGAILDPDGDGYTTDFELVMDTNPLHANSYPGHSGAGFRLDWDGDGYTNDFELVASGDPFHECSHPGNRRGIVTSC